MRPPHVPGRRADNLFFALDDETEPFVEFDVFPPVGFEIAGDFFLHYMLDITLHERAADSAPLQFGSDGDGPEMHMRLVRIEVTPAGKPPDDFGDRLVQRSEQSRENLRQFLRRRETIRRLIKVDKAGHRAID